MRRRQVKTLRLALLLALALGALALDVRAQKPPADVQYFWAAPDRVYLWRTPESPQPVIATLISEANSNWSIQPPTATEEWRQTLQEILKHYKPKAKLDATNNDQTLWDFVLTKLGNEPTTATWAKPRKPAVEIYVRKTDAVPRKSDAIADVVFVWSDGGTPKVDSYQFKFQTSKWKQATQEPIPVEKFLNLDPFSTELRKVLDIPEAEAIPQRDWSAVWDKWLKAALDKEEPRPVTYFDKNQTAQWLWRERLAPGAALPKGFKEAPKRASPLKEPFISEEQGQTQTWWDWPYTKVLIVVAAAVVIAALIRLTVFLYGKWGHRLVGFVRGVVPRRWRRGARSAGLAVSAEGLNALYDLLQKQEQEQPITPLSEFDKKFHLDALRWVRERSKLVLVSDQFREVSDSLKQKAIEEYEQELGVEQETDRKKVKEWVTLGSALEKKKEEFERARQLPHVKEALDGLNNGQKAEGIPALSDVLPQLPGLLTGLNERLTTVNKKHEDLQTELQQLKDSRDADHLKVQQDTKAKWQGEVTRLGNELTTKTTEHATATEQNKVDVQTIKDLREEVAKLQRDLGTAHRGISTADTERGVFEKKVNTIKEVEQLSRYMRQWIQAYYNKQQPQAHDTRHVALLAALVNQSVYQLCFSIVNDQMELRKAVTNNLFRCMEHINISSNYPAALDILERIDPKAQAALKELRDFNKDGTLDDRLIQSFLSTLRADSGLDLSPFFIDISKEKITVTSAS
jgi:hypothetical protein